MHHMPYLRTLEITDWKCQERLTARCRNSSQICIAICHIQLATETDLQRKFVLKYELHFDAKSARKPAAQTRRLTCRKIYKTKCTNHLADFGIAKSAQNIKNRHRICENMRRHADVRIFPRAWECHYMQEIRSMWILFLQNMLRSHVYVKLTAAVRTFKDIRHRVTSSLSQSKHDLPPLTSLTTTDHH